MDDRDANGMDHKTPSKTDHPNSPFTSTIDSNNSTQDTHQSVSGIDVTGAVISQEWSYISRDHDEDGIT